MSERDRIGLVLAGGGARGAYQAGVLKCLAQFASERQAPNPFQIVTGTSAGAINASYVAATCDQLGRGMDGLAGIWSTLRTDMVLRTDVGSLGGIAFKFATDLVLSRFKRRTMARSLLDTAPLRRLIAAKVPFDRIEANLRSGALSALELTASDYANAEIINFVQSATKLEQWSRARRRSVNTTMTLDHVMASSAIPLFFPPVKVGQRYFGDGCLRNTAPLSPAIHLGAKRLVIVGVRKEKLSCELPGAPSADPTIARVLGVMLNAVLMDALEFDIERLSRINHTLSQMPPNPEGVALRPVAYINITPSEDIGAFAATQFRTLPESLRFLIGGLGNMQEAQELISYLLFEAGYCSHLVDLGYRDAMARRDELVDFLFTTQMIPS